METVKFRSAAVVCILKFNRLTPRFSSLVDDESTVCCFNTLRKYCIDENVSTSMLLIKRAINRSDPWSGHIALPGGHVELDETPLEAGIRETFEETGLDLNNSDHFRFIGELEKKKISSGKKRIVVYPLVFIHKDGINQQQLETNVNCEEVYHCWWEDVSSLFKDDKVDSYGFDRLDILSRKNKYKLIVQEFLFRLFNIRKVFVSCFHLNLDHIKFSFNATGRCHVIDYVRKEWLLWGFSYDVILSLKNRIAMNTTMHSKKSQFLQLYDNSEACGILGFSVDNAFWNQYLVLVYFIMKTCQIQYTYKRLLFSSASILCFVGVLISVQFSVFLSRLL